MSEWWFIGTTPRERKEKSAQKILELLDENEKTFSALAEEAEKRGISRATLNKHLKRFVAFGLIQRRVDTSTYPPKVFYKRVKEHPILIMPFEGWRACIGEYPPSREASVEDVKKWIRAQTLLLLAEVVETLSPPPFILGNVSDQEIEDWWKKHNIEDHFKVLYKHLIEMHLDFCKATMFDKEKLVNVTEMLRLYVLSLREEALRLYGLDIAEVAEKAIKGELPKITRRIYIVTPFLKPSETNEPNEVP